MLRELTEARRLRADGWDRYWKLVGEVLSDELHRTSDTPSAEAWIAKHLSEPYRAAFRCVRVAQHAPPADEARYGVARLDAAIAYVETTTGLPTKGDPPIAFGELRIPVSRRGKQRSLGLLDVTPDETLEAAEALAAATTNGRSGNGARKTRVPSVAAAPTSAERAVRTLRSVRLRSIDGHVTFGHVPLAQLEVALRALAKVDWRSLADAPAASAPAPNPVARALVAREKASARSRA